MGWRKVGCWHVCWLLHWSNCLLAWGMDGCIMCSGIISSCHLAVISKIVKHFWYEHDLCIAFNWCLSPFSGSLFIYMSCSLVILTHPVKLTYLLIYYWQRVTDVLCLLRRSWRSMRPWLQSKQPVSLTSRCCSVCVANTTWKLTTMLCLCTVQAALVQLLSSCLNYSMYFSWSTLTNWNLCMVLLNMQLQVSIGRSAALSDLVGRL